MAVEEYELGSNPNITQKTPEVQATETQVVVNENTGASFADVVAGRVPTPEAPIEPQVQVPVIQQVVEETPVAQPQPTPQVVVESVVASEKIVETKPTGDVKPIEKIITAGEVRIMGNIDKSIKEKLIQLKKDKISANKKVTLKFTLFHSGYTGEIIALPRGARIKYKSVVGDPYTRTNALYRLIYDHIKSTSIFADGSVPDFTTWLKITSYLDYETLLHALYSRTYPTKIEYTLPCGNLVKVENDDGEMVDDVCQHGNKVLVAPTSFAIVRDEKVAIKLLEIIHDSSNKEELLRKSNLNATKRIAVDEGLFVHIQVPSLHKFLTYLQEITKEDFETYAELVQHSLFTSAILYPAADPNTGKTEFIMDTSIDGILRDFYYTYVTDEDIVKIDEAIVNFTEKYAIRYQTPPVKCEACEQVVDAQPANIDNLFFRSIEST